MTEFRTPPEEISRLLAELEDVRDAVRALAARVVAIDKHLRRAYQIPKAPRTPRAKERSSGPSVDRDTLLLRFDELRAAFVERGAPEAEMRMASISDDDLRLIARELGLPNSKKAAIGKIRAHILQRLRESALLGVGTVLRGAEESARTESSDTAATPDSDGPDAADR